MKNILTLLLLCISVLGFSQHTNSSKDTLLQKIDTIYSTPYIDGLSFLKVRTGNKESIFLSVTLHSTTAIEGQKGASILLDNGKAINKSNAVITVKPFQNSNSYIYSSLLELSDNDISFFRNHNVFRFRLYVYYNDVKEGQKLKEELIKLLAKP